MSPQQSVVAPVWQADRDPSYRGQIYIEYQGRQVQAVIECEVWETPGKPGHYRIHLCCPLCQKGRGDLAVEASGPTVARSLTLDSEKKSLALDWPDGGWHKGGGKLTVHEPVGCSYCKTWSVHIRDGVAYDAS